MITLPSSEEIGRLFRNAQLGDMGCGSKHLLREIAMLAGQEFELQGLALVLLVAARKSFRYVYGKGKSMSSLEGWVLLTNILPRYIKVLVPDERVAKTVIRDTEAQFLAVMT